jgi:competence protein ComEC
VHDLGGKPIDLLWITHPHRDHAGGAVEVLTHFAVGTYVDNCVDTELAHSARDAALTSGAKVMCVTPSQPSPPWHRDGFAVAVEPVLPPRWPASCPDHPNSCSIGLRVTFCDSEVLFVGDADKDEEALLRPLEADVLQVAHHGSDTSSSAEFLRKVHPRYAVVSADKPGHGLNAQYCLPRESAISRVSEALPGPRNATMRAFDGQGPCTADEAHWVSVAVPEGLWSTARDGSISLVTNGDGVFRRETTPSTISVAPATPEKNEPYFPTCAMARALGVAPLRRGEPGYRPALDRDGDGVACER